MKLDAHNIIIRASVSGLQANANSRQASGTSIEGLALYQVAVGRSGVAIKVA